MQYIKFLKDVQDNDFNIVGAKCMRLTFAYQNHFSVPYGFVVTTNALDLFLTENFKSVEQYKQYLLSNNGELPSELLNEKITRSIQNAVMPTDLVEEIEEAYASDSFQNVSVRSSASYEDSCISSYAGMLYTALNISGIDRILDEIKRCWISAIKISFLEYGEKKQDLFKTAVLIQKMIPAKVAGTIFTKEIMQEDTTIIINANWGLGKTVVEASMIPDEYQLRKTDLVLLNKKLAYKEKKLVCTAEQGTEQIKVSYKKRKSDSLSKQQLQELGRLAKNLEQLFGYPLDIEWAIVQKCVYLLQVRPLSQCRISHQVDWSYGRKGTKWTRIWRLGEWIAHPVSPLFESLVIPILTFARENAGTGKLQWNLPKCWVLKRPYYCIKNGYFFTRAEINKLSFLKFLALTVPRIEQAIKKWKEEDLPRYVEHLQMLKKVSLAKLEDQELMMHIYDLCMEGGDWWYLMALDGGGAGFMERVLKRFVDKHIISGMDVNILFQGFDNKLIEGQIQLYKLAKQFEHNERILRIIENPENLDWKSELSQSTEGRNFLVQYEAYLATYAKMIFDLDFLTPSLIERPEIGLYLIYNYTTGNLSNPERIFKKQIAKREQMTQTILKKLEGSAVKKKIFIALLERVQSLITRRENTVFYFQSIFSLIRAATYELGNRLCERGDLMYPEDIYYYYWNEVYNLRSNPAQKREWLLQDRNTMIEGRKQDFQFYESLSAPEQLLSSKNEKKNKWKKKNLVTGIGIYGGKISGKVKVIHTFEDLKEVKKGEIIVAVTYMPVWAPFLSIAAAVITEVGGITSHSSIIIREYGIPAIIGTGNATQVFHDGQVVEVDATKGVASII